MQSIFFFRYKIFPSFNGIFIIQISGMEQTSFLFQQASKVGFSHSNILRTVIQHACLRFPSLHRYSVVSSPYPRKKYSKPSISPAKHQGRRRKVYVIFGGDTSERQVSLMSGTNVWLNLQTFSDVSFRHPNLLFRLWSCTMK